MSTEPKLTNRGLRYFALGAGTALTGLMLALDKLSPEVGAGIVVAILGIAGADMIKHRND